MGVDWRAAQDNSNWWLNTYAPSWANALSPGEQEAVRGFGGDLSGMEAAGKLGHDPLKWHGQLGQESAIANEARYSSQMGLAQLAQQLAQSQLNATGGLLQQRRVDAGKTLDQADQTYGDVQAGLGRGYDNARGEIESVGRSGRQDILDRGRQQIGDTTASLASRGLGGTTVVDNAKRGVNYDTDRSLGSFNEGLAGLRSGLAERRAGAEAQAGTNLANFRQGRAGMEAGLAGDLGNFSLQRTGIETGLLNNRIGLIGQRTDTPWTTDQASAMAQVGAATKKPDMWGQILGGVAGAGVGGLLGGLGSGLGTSWGSSLFKLPMGSAGGGTVQP